MKQMLLLALATAAGCGSQETRPAHAAPSADTTTIEAATGRPAPAAAAAAADSADSLLPAPLPRTEPVERTAQPTRTDTTRGGDQARRASLARQAAREAIDAAPTQIPGSGATDSGRAPDPRGARADTNAASARGEGDGQQSAVDQAIDRAVAAYQRARTARATFEQTITNSLTGRVVNSRGEFEQMRPNLFAFRFTDPKGDLVLSDGKVLWLYLPSTNPNQVIRMPLTERGAGSLDLAGEFFDSPRTRYTIGDAGAATIGDHSTRAVTLVPKEKGGPFTRAKVWIDVDDGTLRQFEIVEPSGLQRRVRIIDYVPNAPVSAASFRFTPPKGARIVDQSAIGG